MYHYVSLVNNLWLLLVAYQWVFYSYYWGIFTCFLTVFAFLGLRELANNLAEPFGCDESDIPGEEARFMVAKTRVQCSAYSGSLSFGQGNLIEVTTFCKLGTPCHDVYLRLYARRLRSEESLLETSAVDNLSSTRLDFKLSGSSGLDWPLTVGCRERLSRPRTTVSLASYVALTETKNSRPEFGTTSLSSEGQTSCPYITAQAG